MPLVILSPFSRCNKDNKFAQRRANGGLRGYNFFTLIKFNRRSQLLIIDINISLSCADAAVGR